MLLPIIGARLHGFLDDVVVGTYLLGLWLLGLQGTAAVIAAAGAALHFALTRFTDYPQGTFKRIPFRAHAFIELAEGIGVLLATLTLAGSQPFPARAFLVAMGGSQFFAFAFSDYRTPTASVP
jgi:hypothetical protein